MDGQTEGQGEWDPFGRPIFDDPATQGLDRVGVVDVGSNSVRLVVFDGAARNPAYFYNEKVMCALGEGMESTGRLNPRGRERALAAIRRFTGLAAAMNLPPLSAVATAAMRTAEDGDEFRQQIERETGLALHVIDGEEEARFSAQGVLLGWPDAEGLVCDIGGSSMELARVSEGRVWERATSGLGPLRLAGLSGGKTGRAAEIDAQIQTLKSKVSTHETLYLVGGSWRAVARLDMVRRGYPLLVLNEYCMTPTDVRTTLDWVKTFDLEVLRKTASLSSARISLVPIAGEVLRRMLTVLKVRRVVISAYGLREGLLYEKMPQRVRARDPLIEAAIHAERRNARVPGFGRVLHGFIAPLFQNSKIEDRLIQAACLLHDVNWRAHPDYRAEVGFDSAVRGNLGGIGHEERIFLAVALLYRYRNARPGKETEPLLALLDPTWMRDAEILGKAMRFGAMFSLTVPEKMGSLNWRPKKRELELHLSPEAAALYGEVAAARFASLARSMEARTSVLLTSF